VPRIPTYPNQESYTGEILHTADYKNGAPYAGKPVLVVGFGNSAAEIALDLMEHGAISHISVRSPSVVVPRDVAGIPILTLARWLSVFPPRVADWLSKPVLAMTVGDISKVGLPPASWGPLEQVATSRKVPMIDVGTMDALRKGTIEARPGIERFTETGVVFTNGDADRYDAVIFGTGYDAAVGSILENSDGLFDEEGLPVVSGGVTARPGLYFCGFHEPPTGRLREIGIEAERIGELIAGGAPAT
jgi:cation diffusion facilitator CzcD-associated flavoprotein CzcO